MNEVWERDSEEGANHHDPKSEEQFQSFTIISAQWEPQVVIICLELFFMFLIFSIAGSYEIMAMPAGILFIISIIAFVAATFYLRARYQNRDIVTLYDDKLSIKNNAEITISFYDIKSYLILFNRGTATLVIKLKNSSKVKIRSTEKDDFDMMRKAFETKIQQLNGSNQLSIKKSKDWTLIIFTALLLSLMLYIICNFIFKGNV